MAAPTNILTADQALEHALHATALDKLKLPALQTLNNAGYYMINMYPWRWLTPQTAFLTGRANVSLTTATWVEATRTLTQVGGFAGYTFVDGDIFETISGTGVITASTTQGKHSEVESRTSDDAVVLVESISSAGIDLATGDIAGTVHTPTLELPSDFGGIKDISSTNSLVNDIQMVPHEQILALRTNQVEVTSSWSYRAAVTYVGSPPRPVIDLYPDLVESAVDLFNLFYKRGWARLAAGSAIVDIPDFCNGLFLQIVRAFALGYEDEDQGNLDQRLMVVSNGPLFTSAQQFDRMVQPTFGQMRGGAIARSSKRYGPNALATQISGPT